MQVASFTHPCSSPQQLRKEVYHDDDRASRACAQCRLPADELLPALAAVVALRKYQRASQRVAFTRFNVFLRDRFTCQYCGEVFPSSALTFEHVVPRSRGGQTTWFNIVTACVPCNTAKGNSLRIKPRRQPREPTLNDLLAAKRGFPPGYLHESWTDYLYWDAQLDP